MTKKIVADEITTKKLKVEDKMVFGDVTVENFSIGKEKLTEYDIKKLKVLIGTNCE